MKDKNISNCALRVFSLYKKLLTARLLKEDLLDGFSEDSLLLYLNTLRALGVKISSPKSSDKFYSLKSRLDFLSLTSYELNLFSDIKKLLSENETYIEIIGFNNFLVGLREFVDDSCAEKLNNIIAQRPFGFLMHEKLLKLDSAIKEEQVLLIEYNSPNSSQNYFKILPKMLKLQKGKMYIWGVDSSLDALRCIRLDRIKDFHKIDDDITIFPTQKSVVCEFSSKIKQELFLDENIEILSENTEKIKAKCNFYNDFVAMQRILSFGKFCEVIEPVDFKVKIQEKLMEIGKLYEK